MDRPTWYSITNQDDGSSDLYIFNEIGLGGITAEAFMTDLRAITARKINLHLNSPGGDVFDGIAIHNTLKQHPAEITVMVDALAASIASVIAMAGDRIIMARHSSMMIHEAHGMAVGDAEDMVMMADRLNVISEQIASIYKERVPGSKQVTWRNRMKAETWYTEEEAVKAGLADEVGPKAAVTNHFDLSAYHYRNAPTAISQPGGEPAEPSNPYPSEHACRLREPGDFEPNSFRRMSREDDGKPYDIITGKLKGEDTMTEQAYRYPKDEWKEADARKHCTDHDGKTFEPASGEGGESDLDALTQTLIPPLAETVAYQKPTPSLQRLLTEDLASKK